MDKWYLYCDADSKEVLESPTPKVFLVGSDFGYGNFGDILQLKGTIRLHHGIGSFTPVPVFAVEAISDPDFISYAKRVYGTSCILFVSQKALDFSETGICLEEPLTFRSVELMHLYGGGFLNEKWGDYVLSVTEFLISVLKIPTYVISGQQVDAIFSERAARHITAFKPLLVGVRDELSRQNLVSNGIDATYSFDDAYEELQEIAAGFDVDVTGGLLIHLNLSTYTGNSRQPDLLYDHLDRLAATKAAKGGLTVINAFNDKRHFVIDTLSSIKEMEKRFPFDDYRVIDGCLLAYSDNRYNKRLAVSMAYSCSYHVTMFMHLLGVPCWLNSNNNYYSQKCLALGIEQSFEEFLASPMLPSYERRLAARRSWLDKLVNCIQGLIPERREITPVFDFDAMAISHKFAYKSNEVASIHDVEWHQGNATKYWEEASHFKWKLGLVEQDITRKEQAIASLNRSVTESAEQIASLNQALAERDRQIASLNQSVVEREAQIAGLNQAIGERDSQIATILSSLSWRITRPLRVLRKLIIGDS